MSDERNVVPSDEAAAGSRGAEARGMEADADSRGKEAARVSRGAGGGLVRTILRRIGYTLLGILLYAIAMNMFSGYPEIGSQWINRAATLAIVIFAAVVFIRDERRRSREDEDDPHADAR
ncbi:hypothetical protein [Brevibacterium metallidurans]|uniref:Uncharacterized protein n=1 Tax=Brevibacterium metallidurans TaxID=1482676 RepID=A0ABP3CBZ4_9MICO